MIGAGEGWVLSGRKWEMSKEEGERCLEATPANQDGGKNLCRDGEGGRCSVGPGGSR